MGIYRVSKDNNFVVMNKTALQDERLSWKAKGLLAYMLSMPDNWRFYREELATHAKDGVDSVKSALKELGERGYLKRVRKNDENGKIYWETIVYEIPQEDSPPVEKPPMVQPQVGKPPVEKPSVENPLLLNNKELNNKELKKEEEANAYLFYQQNIGMISPFQWQQLYGFVEHDGMEEAVLIEAMKQALLQNKLSVKYITAILNDWKKSNIKTVGQAQAKILDFEQRKSQTPNYPKEVKSDDRHGRGNGANDDRLGCVRLYK
ncbi:DnaD domain protein [Halalkalibacterium ligniniphilum]|uniref:DnaD domain protein n=1 Tax=Halalkalibacterium ligniniphilum TaxID=1134413 RepID=UPI00034B06F0|nr:DnaD domain protein [Halalkalibacterium ligniniphilum]